MRFKSTLVPAYGRDYKSKKAVQADLDAGKDFIVQDISSKYDGQYINLQDLKNEGVSSVFIRYNQLRDIAEFKIR